MDKQVLERVLALMPLASKDETRFHLCGVYLVAGDPGTIELQVTDGHRATIETVDSSLDLSRYEKGIFVAREYNQMIKFILKQIGKMQDVQLKLVGNMITCGTFGSIPFEEGNKPDMKRLIPKKGDHCLSFNARYLAEIMKALRESNSEGVQIWFDVDTVGEAKVPKVKNAEPLTVVCGSRNAVLMPMRI